MERNRCINQRKKKFSNPQFCNRIFFSKKKKKRKITFKKFQFIIYASNILAMSEFLFENKKMPI